MQDDLFEVWCSLEAVVQIVDVGPVSLDGPLSVFRPFSLFGGVIDVLCKVSLGGFEVGSWDDVFALE